jgi:hypothetical protein
LNEEKIFVRAKEKSQAIRFVIPSSPVALRPIRLNQNWIVTLSSYSEIPSVTPRSPDIAVFHLLHVLHCSLHKVLELLWVDPLTIFDYPRNVPFRTNMRGNQTILDKLKFCSTVAVTTLCLSVQQGLCDALYIT